MIHDRSAQGSSSNGPVPLDGGPRVATSPGTSLRLELEGVSKRYGTVRALENINFELRPGEIMALVGENGAGKSTLVKLLSGAIEPDSGQIRANGHDVTLGSPKKAMAAGIAVVQQEISVLDNLSAAENVLLGRAEASAIWQPGRIRRLAAPLLRSVGLGHIDSRIPAGELSVGDRQLVEIARVLGSDASVIAFDEPTAALSDAEIARVLNLIRGLCAQGRSIIYISHRLDEIFALASRVTVMRNGSSTPPVRTADLTIQQLVTAMLGRDLPQLFPERGTPREVSVEARGLAGPGIAKAVSLTARKGEIVGLIGQIGSGAVSTVRAMAGLVQGSSGAVLLEGVNVDLSSRAAGIRRGVAYCSDDRKSDGIFADVSVMRNLSSPWISRIAKLGVRSSSKERSVALDACSAFEIDPKRLDTAVGTLSGGNQQKVALGKWLGSAPKLLLVEEPTRGVDIGARAEIYARLRDLCQAGLTIVLTSTDTAEVMGLCDTIGAFFRGTLVDIRDQAEWTEEELLKAVLHPSEQRSAS